MTNRATWFAAIFVAAVVTAVAGGFWWCATQSSAILYLPSPPVGEWIVPDLPMKVGSHPASPLDYRFWCEFEIEGLPSEAVLELNSPSVTRIRLNDRDVGQLGARDDRGWKVSSQYNVTEVLKLGRNRLSIEVVTDEMVPPIWARLDGDGIALSTDTTWSVDIAGAGSSQAVFARDILVAPKFLTLQLGLPDLRTALRRSGLTWLLLGGVAALLCVLLLKWPWQRPVRAVVIFGVFVWTTLFSLNAANGLVPFGYDITAHLDYIEFVRSGQGLPLADDGWEMFHPPLYYLTAAGLLKIFGATSQTAVGLLLLRGLGFTSGMAIWLLVVACLRELFPKRPQAVVFGALIAILAPSLICTAHYVTNEAFAAAWCCAALLCGLRMLRSERCSVWLAIALGVCLGAALLSKVTAVLTLFAIVTALSVRLTFRGPRGPRAWLTSIVLPVVICLALCSWHYARVWNQFGTPFVTNHHPATGFAHWQNPGFRVFISYARFGRCLVEPIFCGSWSLMDGYFATFWGDSQLSGSGEGMWRPPWNYDLMVIGYWLALLPTIGILIGYGAAVVEWCRVRDAGWLLVLGLALLTASAMGYMTLKWPVWGQARASYGLPAMAALCAFGGWGLHQLAGRGGFRRWAVSIGVSTWAATVLATFAVVPWTAQTLTFRSLGLMEQRDFHNAFSVAERARRADPAYEPATMMLMNLFWEAGLQAEASRVAERALLEQPESYLAYLLAAQAALRDGRAVDAVQHARQAASMAPRYWRCHATLGRAFADSGRYQEAIEILQTTLRLHSADSDSRSLIAECHERLGHVETGREHRRRLPQMSGQMTDPPST